MRFTFEENILIHNNRTKRVKLRSDPSIHQLLRLQYFFVKIGTYSLTCQNHWNRKFSQVLTFPWIIDILKISQWRMEKFLITKTKKLFYTHKRNADECEAREILHAKKSIENFFITIAPATVSSLTKSTHEVFFACWMIAKSCW